MTTRHAGLALLVVSATVAAAGCMHLRGALGGGGAAGGPAVAGAPGATIAPPPQQPRAAAIDATPRPGVARTGTIRLAPGFVPIPVDVRGEAVGRRAARALGRAADGSACGGRIGNEPDWTIELEQPFAYLRVETDGPALAVVGPDRVVRCGAPRVSGAFGPGRLEVYVAAPRRGTASYALHVSELRPEDRGAHIDAVADPRARFGRLWLAGDLDGEPVLHGTSGGPLDARTLGTSLSGRCVGYVDAVPAHLVYVGAQFPYLRVETESPEDTTLVMRGPQGLYCDDDSGTNEGARLAGPFPPGLYEVWVGSYGRDDRAAYRLVVSRQEPPARVEPEPAPAAPVYVAVAPPPPQTVYVQAPAPPTRQPYVAPAPEPVTVAAAPAPASSFGTVRLQSGFMPDPYVVQGVSGGAIHATQLGYADPCRGWLAQRPDHVLELTSDVPYLRIDVAAGGGDTTLVVVRSDGTSWCDDDGSGSVDPRVTGYFAAGRYEIRVGSYRQGEAFRYGLSFSEYAPPAAPAYAQQPAAPASPQPVDDARFEELRQYYAATRYPSEQPATARELVTSGNWFTCAQIGALVQATGYPSLEPEVAATLFEHATDRENMHRIIQVFRYSSSADDFRRRVGQ